jgi:hypothetical protein
MCFAFSWPDIQTAGNGASGRWKLYVGDYFVALGLGRCDEIDLHHPSQVLTD